MFGLRLSRFGDVRRFIHLALCYGLAGFQGSAFVHPLGVIPPYTGHLPNRKMSQRLYRYTLSLLLIAITKTVWVVSLVLFLQHLLLCVQRRAWLSMGSRAQPSKCKSGLRNVLLACLILGFNYSNSWVFLLCTFAAGHSPQAMPEEPHRSFRRLQRGHGALYSVRVKEGIQRPTTVTTKGGHFDRLQ